MTASDTLRDSGMDNKPPDCPHDIGRRNNDDFLKHEYSPISPHRHSQNLTSTILPVIFITFTGALILVASLYYCASWYVLRRQARRRGAFRVVTVDRPNSTPQPKSGLDPTVKAMLPVTVFKQTEGDPEHVASEIDCSVCLSSIEDGEMTRLLPNCKHTFHVACIDGWFKSHTTCPVCRKEVKPQLPQEPREAPAGFLTISGVAETEIPAASLEAAISTPDETSSGSQSSSKTDDSSSRLSSLKRMIGRARSPQRIQSCSQEDDMVDLEKK